jgi:arylsulfatase A-like enzyme
MMKNISAFRTFLLVFSLSVYCSNGFSQKRPNIIIILADDMGYSDLGCYGSEIPTPNLDALAGKGVRLTQFYNNARCCPTRASLMTGLYPHQAGIGRMSEDPEAPKTHDEGVDGYRGSLSKNSVTIAEVLKTSGYHTYMSGKWHLGLDGKDKWPLQRGFEKYYGILGGGSSYLKPFPPRGVTSGNGEMQYDFPQGYYTTDAFTDSAIAFLTEQKDRDPFFLYLAFNAPHWPLQAKEKDIERFRNAYLIGWDSVKHERLRRQIKLGVTNAEWAPSKSEMRPWNELTSQEKRDVAYRMSVYAAQVYCLDYNVGKLIDYLKKKDQFNNTLILFMSDNGASAEPYLELGGRPQAEVNDPLKFWQVSYGVGWASVSDMPFKKWKNTTYEGGTSAPFIASWPDKLTQNTGGLNFLPYHVIDLMPTVLEAAEAKYPAVYQGHSIIKTEGISLLPALLTGKGKVHDYFYWEHEENCAVLHGQYKGVKRLPDGKWELYNTETDRTETINIAAQNPVIVADLDQHWQAWADANKVFPKGRIYDERLKNGQLK